jgi:hypothetical protein
MVKFVCNGKTVRLGRIQPRVCFDAGAFRVHVFPNGTQKVIPKFGAHYNRALDRDPPPASVDYSPKALAALARMYLNDTYGDCVIASKGHQVGIWSGNETGTAVQATDAEILQNYTSICGPGDQGCVITDVLDAMKAGKFIMNGQPALIDNYVAVDWTQQNLVAVALDVFGAVTLGVNLTDDCTTSGPGVVWNFSGSIVGGHDIPIYAYDSKGVYISTWGTIGTLIPWSVLTKNAGNGPGVEEAEVALSPNWYSQGNLAPNGINAATLAADLALVGGGAIPPVGPTPTPVPPAPVPPSPTPPSPGDQVIGYSADLNTKIIEVTPPDSTWTVVNGIQPAPPSPQSLVSQVQSAIVAAGKVGDSNILQEIIALLQLLLGLLPSKR